MNQGLRGRVAAALRLAAAAALLCSAANAASEEKVVLRTGEWPPYVKGQADECSSGVGGGYGLLAQIVTAALQNMGKTPVYQFQPWLDGAELEQVLQSESVLGAFPYRETKKRKERFAFSEPLFSGRPGLYFNVEKIDQPASIRSRADLKR